MIFRIILTTHLKFRCPDHIVVLYNSVSLVEFIEEVIILVIFKSIPLNVEVSVVDGEHFRQMTRFH